MSREQPEDARLEEGLRHLRDLGYLRSPAEMYLARKMPRDGSSLRAAAVTAVWVGVGGGLVVGLLLWLTAVLADPSLLDRFSDLLWLFVDFLLVTSNVGMLLLFLFTWPVLARLRRDGDYQTGWLQRIAVLLPGTVLTLYLADALGRHLLPRLEPSQWWIGVGSSVLLAASIGALVSVFLGALIVVARMRLRGVKNPAPVTTRERWRPWLLDLLLATLLLVVGPYRDMRALPRLDQLPAPPQVDIAEPTLLVAIDGVRFEEVRDDVPRTPSLASLARVGGQTITSHEEHPAAFWNSVATGFSSREHGLESAANSSPRGFVGDLDAIESNPILATLSRYLLPGIGLGTRQATDQRELSRPAFWEIAAHAGRRAMIVNWWASYPAARHPRLEVASDRWILRLWESRATAAEDSLLQAPFELPRVVLDREGFGPDLLQNVFAFRARHDAVRAGDRVLAESVFSELDGWNTIPETWAYASTADAFHVLLAESGLVGTERDFIGVHLNGADMVARRIAAHAEAFPQAREEQRLGLELLDHYAEFVDQLVGNLIAQHNGPLLLVGAAVDATAEGREVWGAWRDSGGRGPLPIDPLGLAPRMLAYLGLPRAGDMIEDPEGPALGLEGPGTYGGRPNWTPRAGRRAADLERLRSLGYIGN